MSTKLQEKKYRRFIEDVVECITEWKSTQDLSLEEACENNKLKIYLKLSYTYGNVTTFYNIPTHAIKPFPDNFSYKDIVIKEDVLDLSFLDGVEKPLDITLYEAMLLYKKGEE